MARQKQFSGEVVKTTAQVPAILHTEVRVQLARMEPGATVIEAINDGLVLWMALKTGDKHLRLQLEEILKDWKDKIGYAEVLKQKTAKKIARNSVSG